MSELFSGFVVGYAFSLLFTAVAAVMVIKVRSEVPYLSKAIASNRVGSWPCWTILTSKETSPSCERG